MILSRSLSTSRTARTAPTAHTARAARAARASCRGWVLVAGLMLALTGCSKEEAKGGGVPSSLLDAWKKANLTISAFTADKSGAIGPTCHSGTVNGLDVVWCAFSTDEEAKAAEPKGLAWVGEATGTALASGKQLLAVVDRRAADPSGRTINAVTKAFR